MQINKIKQAWLSNYAQVETQLEKIKQVKSVVTAFNSNLDAVIKIKGEDLQKLSLELNFNLSDLDDSERRINSPYDVLRGIIKCFAKGNAEEWLIDNQDPFIWIKQTFPHYTLQLGGQAGIVANTLAVCKVQKVFVHAASLPQEQAQLFVDLPNLVSTDEQGLEKKAWTVNRSDPSMIHWIFEFNKGDTIKVNNQVITCPKANRFIATYDPFNFNLKIDELFSQSAAQYAHDYIFLSGYHLLQENNAYQGIARIEESLKHVARWQKKGSSIVHLEIASTQDKTIRSYLLNQVIPKVDSIGLNDRETIDLLQTADEQELAQICEQNPSADNMFQAVMKIFLRTNCPRIQLHMFGLYLTIQRKDFKRSPAANLNGMMFASTIAAQKAKYGQIDPANLTEIKNQVSEPSLQQLLKLADLIKNHFGSHDFSSTGIYTNNELAIIAVPTILVEKPISLVGMGDTISSLSLISAG